MIRPRVLQAWSSGKDSAYCLHLLRRRGDVEVVGLLTTVGAVHDRVSMHGVRRALLMAQADALGLPLQVVSLPQPCSNRDYDEAMAAALAEARQAGVGAVAFGDVFLADVRRYREQRMAGSGMAPLFPLWGRPSAELAREMIAEGVQARLTCIDLGALQASFAQRDFDQALLDEMPPGIDPCGENGEFHTFVWNGPGFRAPLPLRNGEVVEREGFVFADLQLASDGADDPR